MSGTVIVFAGPTLSGRDVEAELEATCLPPVSQGDVYHAALERPFAIGIVDGFFERAPAVWHKEILWALSRGVHVFGAASMGALRAAELQAFGMVGVGRIFEAFRDGVLTDDDEVAVRHAEASARFRPASEALVNMRATFEAAAQQGIVSLEDAATLNAHGKRLFYAERTYPRVLAEAGAAGVSAGARARLEAWLPAGRVDLKRLDALAMLRAMRELRASGAAPFQPSFAFARTDMWEQVGRAGRAASRAAAGSRDLEELVDELRIAGADRYAGVLEQARARAVVLAEARRQGVGEGPAASQMGETPVTERLAREQAAIARVHDLYASDAAGLVPDVLRLEGGYEDLLARARAKREVLRRFGLDGQADDSVPAGDVVAWFFETRLAGQAPADLNAHAARLGCRDRHALLRLIWREWWFAKLQGGRSDRPD